MGHRNREIQRDTRRAGLVAKRGKRREGFGTLVPEAAIASGHKLELPGVVAAVCALKETRAPLLRQRTIACEQPTDICSV
jgi:hypothetical protein